MLLIFSDVVKLIASTGYSTKTWVIFIFTYFMCWLLMAILSAYYENMENFTSIFEMPSTWLALLFYIFS
jgi:ABC-type Na+ efflux pump permease subunit